MKQSWHYLELVSSVWTHIVYLETFIGCRSSLKLQLQFAISFQLEIISTTLYLSHFPLPFWKSSYVFLFSRKARTFKLKSFKWKWTMDSKWKRFQLSKKISCLNTHGVNNDLSKIQKTCRFFKLHALVLWIKNRKNHADQHFMNWNLFSVRKKKRPT